jgi:hypothetical protein
MFAAGEMPQLVDLGEVGGPAYWLGKGLQVMALMVRAGDRNPASAAPTP